MIQMVPGTQQALRIAAPMLTAWQSDNLKCLLKSGILPHPLPSTGCRSFTLLTRNHCSDQLECQKTRSAHFTGTQWSPGAVRLDQKPRTLASHLEVDTCHGSFSEKPPL